MKAMEHIDWQQFHFLRPHFFWLLAPLLVTILLLLWGNRERNKWKRFVAAHLRPYMFTKGSRGAFIAPLLLFILGTVLAVAGIAGPTWSRTSQPAEKIQAVTLLCLDVSGSMLCEDIPPNRLERAKLKTSDLLHSGLRTKTAVVAYSGTPHLVIPYTADVNLLQLHVASLANKAMPVQGTNTALLLRLADTLLKPVKAPGTIVLMTDELKQEDAVLLADFTSASAHRIEVLLVSSPVGAAIPGAGGERSQQDPAVLHNLAAHPHINITPLTLDTTDVGRIAERINQHLVFEKAGGKEEKSWDDKGYLLIYPALLITLLWFRKGWSIQWCLLPLLFCSCNSDWWFTPDYQGQRLYTRQHYLQAAGEFSDLRHKAAAYYHAGKYEAALSLFELDSSAAGQYNKALALVKLGRYEDAEAAFEAAGAKDPSLRQKAAAGRKHAALAQLQADSVMRIDQKEKELKEVRKDSLRERKPKSKDEQLSSDTKAKELPKKGDRVTDEVASDIHRAKEGTNADTGRQPTTGESPKNIIMQKPVADPGEFLHKRFVLQAKKYYPKVKTTGDQW